jgi:hypothetical protein
MIMSPTYRSAHVKRVPEIDRPGLLGVCWLPAGNDACGALGGAAGNL